MYHDQALIPLKTIDFAHGVNVTLGLPFIRTSPDHGTALDIAGSGKADPASLIAALKLAGEMAQRRAAQRASSRARSRGRSPCPRCPPRAGWAARTAPPPARRSAQNSLPPPTRPGASSAA